MPSTAYALQVNLARRLLEDEWMDEPGLDPRLHAGALDGLGRINRISGSVSALWTRIRDGAHAAEEPLRVLDVGCGGGDLVVRLSARATATGCRIRVDGCDISPFALDHARRLAAARGVRDCRFFRHDIVSAPLPDRYDVVVCSLFLHHFDDAEAIVVLDRMNAAARRLVVVQDLRRTRVGYVLAWVGCRALSRSPVVHADGPRSVARAFTPPEARRLAERAGLSGVEVRNCWPQRFILTAGRGCS